MGFPDLMKLITGERAKKMDDRTKQLLKKEMWVRSVEQLRRIGII